MKIAVMSDIHSNHIALEACISYIEKEPVEGIIFLGDYVSDCPNPQLTLELLHELKLKYKTWFIKGNREEYFIRHADGANDDWNYSSYNGSLLYTYERLTKEDIELFRSYPISMTIAIPGKASITIAHGSPVSSRELVYGDSNNAKQYLEDVDTNYLICGHTHKQFVYEYKNKLLLNPGSVGVAIGGHAIAHFAMLSWKMGKWEYTLLHVPYDYSKLQKEFLDSELMRKAKVWPKCILKSIDSGINVGPICAKMAYDLALGQNETIENRIVPEKYWEQAAKILDIY